MEQFDINRAIKVDEWAINGTNFNIIIRRRFIKGYKKIGIEDKNIWCLYATIFQKHPLFKKAYKNKTDYDIGLGNRIYEGFHGGCTYYSKQRNFVRIGCDYNHIWDKCFEQSSEMLDELISDAKDLFNYMNSFKVEE